MIRAEQLALAARWALGVDARYEARYCPGLQVVQVENVQGGALPPPFCDAHTLTGTQTIRPVTPSQWQDATLAALISIAETARESDTVAGRLFDAANGSVTDSAGKIATVPNPRLPQPAVHIVPACVPEEIREELGRAPMVRTRLPLAQPASIYGETNEEVRP